jgi:hypothetical protein
LRQQGALAALHGPNNLHPQLLLGTEVVDQHPMARPERRCQGAQADVGESVLNVGAGGRRIATGTYTLEQLPNGENRIAFEYA